MVVSNGSSSSYVAGGSSEIAVTVAACMTACEVGYPAVLIESS